MRNRDFTKVCAILTEITKTVRSMITIAERRTRRLSSSSSSSRSCSSQADSATSPAASISPGSVRRGVLISAALAAATWLVPSSIRHGEQPPPPSHPHPPELCIPWQCPPPPSTIHSGRASCADDDGYSAEYAEVYSRQQPLTRRTAAAAAAGNVGIPSHQ